LNKQRYRIVDSINRAYIYLKYKELTNYAKSSPFRKRICKPLDTYEKFCRTDETENKFNVVDIMFLNNAQTNSDV